MKWVSVNGNELTSWEVIKSVLVNHFVRCGRGHLKIRVYPRVLQGLDSWGGPGDRNAPKCKRTLYSACPRGSRVLWALGMSAWIFFSLPCSQVPSARLGKFLTGQWGHHVPMAYFLAGEEEGIGWLVGRKGRDPRLGPKDRRAPEGKSPQQSF